MQKQKSQIIITHKEHKDFGKGYPQTVTQKNAKSLLILFLTSLHIYNCTNSLGMSLS